MKEDYLDPRYPNLQLKTYIMHHSYQLQPTTL
jgi:hypothetical protein